ncbi:MAG: hypothetical protein US82_C0027G0004 [Parcubacteria group bacterium GW2011_GWC1_38_22]|nr:MAG: hypothetical protein US82_C0027G0004 [Parcubacteria group bacterium GW2011_GWC1_38_22]
MELYSIHDFTTEDTTWKVCEVEENLVIFRVSEKIKLMMEMELVENKTTCITFKKSDGAWNASVKANGVESYVFARILFAVLARIKCGSYEIKVLNETIIECYTRATFPKTKGTHLGLMLDIGRRRNVYYMTIPIDSVRWTFLDKNVDVLCRDIGIRLRGQIRCRPEEK